MAKDTLDRNKWQPTDWEKNFTNCTSDRVLISKDPNKIHSKESKNPNKKWSAELNKEFSTDEY